MDIGALSVTTNNLNLATEVSASVLSMNLDSIEEAGASMIKLMEQSVQPELGQTIDIKI